MTIFAPVDSNQPLENLDLPLIEKRLGVRVLNTAVLPQELGFGGDPFNLHAVAESYIILFGSNRC
jgi:hypothetical protein